MYKDIFFISLFFNKYFIFKRSKIIDYLFDILLGLLIYTFYGVRHSVEGIQKQRQTSKDEELRH